MFLEAKGSWAEAERAYAVILENNPNDQVLYLLYPLLAFRTLEVFFPPFGAPYMLSNNSDTFMLHNFVMVELQSFLFIFTFYLILF
jgi:hypothetical protein